MNKKCWIYQGAYMNTNIMKKHEINIKCDKNKKIVLCLLILTILGFALRIIACYWGYPYQLHPDEATIVENAIDMISRNSWEANVYNRPDHFEIKCCAVLFQVVSYLKYGVGADVAFTNHTMAFYLIARAYTAFFGTLMIPLVYMMCEKLKKGAGIIAAFITTFYPLFIINSGYATPDIVLATIVLAVAYVSMLYLEKPTLKKVVFMSVLTGIGITVKYTCAICCIWIAIIVILDAIRSKKYKLIMQYGIIAMIIVFGTTFFMAPNLFTNITETIQTLRIEARSVHIGADGLGFWGNFKFYITEFSEYCIGTLTIVIGVFYLIKQKKMKYVSMGLGILFWICTSVLALHWDRWGMPMYVFFVILMALGIHTMCNWAMQKLTLDESGWKKILYTMVYALGVFICACIMIFGVSTTKSCVLSQTRILALEYCLEEGITAQNSIYDGYTPFMLDGVKTISIMLDSEGKICLTEEQQDAEYIIISGTMYNRYYAEEERYAETVAMYDAIQEQCELIKIYESCGFTVKSGGIVNSIINNIVFIFTDMDDLTAGTTIQIYKVPSD